MAINFERVVSKLEKRATKKLQDPLLCTCEVFNRYHYNASCVEAILTKKSRFCPVHGVRRTGMFFPIAPQYALGGENDAYCACPPHPFREFQLNPDAFPNREAAMEAWHNHPKREVNQEEENRKIRHHFDNYQKEMRQLEISMGRKEPSLEVIKKIDWKRHGKNVR